VRELPPGAARLRVTAREVEPRGPRALAGIAADLRRARSVAPPARRAPRWSATPQGPRVAPATLAGGAPRLVLFGGKGGVGKTTCAAALAIDAAAARPRARVLLLSTDPAHSLADVLGAAVTDAPAPVPDGPPNLEVRELDPRHTLARIRARYAEAVDRTFDRVRGGGAFDAAHDRSIMRTLIDLAPPGLDELAAVLEITDALGADPPRWDLVVMDTAPTGHALRLLEMPALIQEWARALMAILLKYEGVARIGEFAEILLRLSQGIGRLRELLARPGDAAFVVVTRAAALPRLETARLLTRLARLRIHVPALVVNAVGRGACRRCVRAARAEAVETARILRLTAARVVLAGARLPPPRGAADLRRWARSSWRDARYHQDR
jgi:arsenite-transporting ATPase